VTASDIDESEEERFLVVRIMVPRCTEEQALQYLEHNEQVDGLSMLVDPTLLEPDILSSALREARREMEELRALTRRMWVRDILSRPELDAIENEMVRLGCISDEERRGDNR